MPLRAIARVNLSAIERNAARLRAGLAEGAELCAVVKADGYGHGAVPAARAALAGGAGSLAVATADEAAELREGEIDAPVLVMGAISSDELPVALAAEARAGGVGSSGSSTRSPRAAAVGCAGRPARQARQRHGPPGHAGCRRGAGARRAHLGDRRRRSSWRER